MTATIKKLTDLENPMQLDSGNPIYVATSSGRAKLVGYSPAGTFADFPIFYVLPEGSKDGSEKMVRDAEIILN